MWWVTQKRSAVLSSTSSPGLRRLCADTSTPRLVLCLRHTREVTQGRISGVGCQPLVSRACIPVFSVGAAEAARVRASPGNPKHIGPLRRSRGCTDSLGPVLPASVYLSRCCLRHSRRCCWLQDSVTMKRVSHFCLTVTCYPFLHPSLPPQLLPSKLPCASTSLSYIGPLGSVREP